MKNMTAFRITALSCFFFALISLVSPFKDSLLPTAVTAVLILAASLAAVHFQKPAVRLAFFIVPVNVPVSVNEMFREMRTVSALGFRRRMVCPSVTAFTAS